MFDIRIIGEKSADESAEVELSKLVTPGEEVSSDPTFMRGHGTYVKDEKIHACVTGTVERINKLYSVKPLKTRYNGEVGDVVVGRVRDVQQRRWIVDVNARLDAVLNLSSVNLPGGECRIKTEEDELKMRTYLSEGDVISAEVHSIFQDGSLCLHTRSLKYGKLGQGTLLKVSPCLILRKKTHFHDNITGVLVILSNNGYIWISPSYTDNVDTGGYAQNLDCVSKDDRETIARVRNCIQALTSHYHMLSDTVILYAYEASINYEAKEILKPEITKEISNVVLQRVKSEGV